MTKIAIRYSVDKNDKNDKDDKVDKADKADMMRGIISVGMNIFNRSCCCNTKNKILQMVVLIKNNPSFNMNFSDAAVMTVLKLSLLKFDQLPSISNKITNINLTLNIIHNCTIVFSK